VDGAIAICYDATAAALVFVIAMSNF